MENGSGYVVTCDVDRNRWLFREEEDLLEKLLEYVPYGLSESISFWTLDYGFGSRTLAVGHKLVCDWLEWRLRWVRMMIWILVTGPRLLAGEDQEEGEAGQRRQVYLGHRLVNGAWKRTFRRRGPELSGGKR